MKMCPFELIATPTASAMIMSVGILKKSGTMWKVSSGAFGGFCASGMSCAQAGSAASNNPSNRTRFMASPLLSFQFVGRGKSIGLLDSRRRTGPSVNRMRPAPNHPRSSCYRILENYLQCELDFPHRDLRVLIDLAEALIVLQ